MMATKEDITQKVMSFFKKEEDTKVLEGEVWIQGARIETPVRRITHLKEPLYFDPALETATTYNNNLMQTLLNYLRDFQPIANRGLIFFPSARFSLYFQQQHLSLCMQGEGNWKQGVAIDVFDRDGLDSGEFDEIIRMLQGRKASSFVFGEIREIINYGLHTTIRRDFLE